MQTAKKYDIRILARMCVFTALIAAGAFIRIPIPVCPFTLQFLFTTLAGMLLGAKRGALCVGVYIVIGLMGVPIFAQGGGPAYVFEPTFGYLIGFCAGAYITGAIAEKSPQSFPRLLLAGASGLAVVYLMGMIYYYAVSALWLGTRIGLWELFLYCFLLAVPGDIVLCFLSAATAKKLLPIVKRINEQ